MDRQQQAARVNVSDDEWINFRTLAMRHRRSIADYLGELVRRELSSPPEDPAAERVQEPPPARRPSRPVRLADQELLTSLPALRSRPEPPPWEE